MKEQKGLADAQEGEFILNESGTTISTDPVEGIDVPALSDPLKYKEKDKEQNTRNTGNERNAGDY